MSDPQQRCFDGIKRAVEILGARRAAVHDVEVFLESVRALAEQDEAHAAVIARIFSQLTLVADNEFKRCVYRRAVHECCGLFNTTTARRLAMLPGPREVKEVLLRLGEGVTVGNAELRLIRTRYDRLFGEKEMMEGDEALIQWISGGDLVHRLVERAFTGWEETDEMRECICTVLACAGTFIARPHACVKMRDVGIRRILRDEVKRRFERLIAMTRMCMKLKPDTPRFEYKPKVKGMLEGLKEETIVGLGILYWARAIIRHTKNEKTLLFTAPMCLGFVDAVAEFHVGLRWRAVDVINDTFERGIETVDIAGQIRDKCVQAFAAMVERGEAHIVVQYSIQYANDTSVDEAHLRGLVRVVLERVAPPFGRPFALMLNKFVTHRRVRSVAIRDRHTKSLVDSFLSEMRQCDIR